MKQSLGIAGGTAMSEDTRPDPIFLLRLYMPGQSHHVPVPRPFNWSGLLELLSRPRPGKKEGYAWMSALIGKGSGFKHRVDAVNHLVLDVQARTWKDPRTGIETVIGPEPPGVSVMVPELDLRGWQYLLHTTYSHLDPEIRPIEVEHHRYRIVFAVSRPIKPAELRPLGHHVASMLGLSDCLHEEAVDPSSFYDLPRMHESRLGAFRFASGEGKPLDVDVLLTEARRSEKAVRGAAEMLGMNIRHNDRKPDAEPGDELRGPDEDVAPCGNDRAADHWSQLIAIAKLIGEPWESRLMSAFVEKNHQVEDESAGVMLLRDIRQIFLEQGKTRMHSEDLVGALVDLPDRPWGGWKHGKPVTKNSLSRVLKPFGIKSKQLRIGNTNRYGYEAEQFADAWARYTGPSPSDSAARNATALQPMYDADSGGSEDARRDSTVAFLDTRKPSDDAGCSGAGFSFGVSSGGACSRCGGEGCGDCREVEP